MSRFVNIPDPDPPMPDPDPFPPPRPPLPDPQPLPPTPPVRPPIPQLTSCHLKEDTMHFLLLLVLFIACITFAAGSASANPSMLPKHDGYPMGKAIDPVTGKPLSNDPGQKNATGEKALQQAAMADDSHSRQNLPKDPNDQRVLESPGAGILPKVEGPQIRIEPPVKEATRTPANPKE